MVELYVKMVEAERRDTGRPQTPDPYSPKAGCLSPIRHAHAWAYYFGDLYRAIFELVNLGSVDTSIIGIVGVEFEAERSVLNW